MRILTETEIDSVAGSYDGFWSGARMALDDASCGALVGGTLGMALLPLGPEMPIFGAAAGAVYGAGIGFLVNSDW